MDIPEVCAVIKYFVKKGLSAKDIHTDMQNTLGDTAPSFSTVSRWTTKFKQSRENVENKPRGECSKNMTTLITPESIEKVLNIILMDPRLKLSEIAETVGISVECALHILAEELYMKKLYARWVPCLLTNDQRDTRITISLKCLEHFQKRTSEFLLRFVTTGTWVYHYSPKTKQQLRQWTHSDFPSSKKAKIVPLIERVMITIFWDAEGILLINYLPKNRTITEEYYADLLERLDKNVLEKRPGMANKKVVLYQDDALPYTSAVSMNKIQELEYGLLEYPPYSPDLAPSYFHLFPLLKNFLGGKTFSSDEEVKDTVDGYFASLDKSEFYTGIITLQRRWFECIRVKGNYVEK